ncbi:unnamed protein product, partial [Arabidopsis halleri]
SSIKTQLSKPRKLNYENKVEVKAQKDPLVNFLIRVFLIK